MAPITEVDTVLSDRQILLHLLAHVEAIHDELEQFRPLLDRFRPGRASMVDAMAAARDMRRARRHG